MTVTAGNIDETFLRTLYASTRQDLDVLGLPAAELASLIDMQWRAKCAGHNAAYPDARDEIIEQDDVAVGRLLVDDAGDVVTIVDIALFPEARGRGIGRDVLRSVCENAGARPVQLHVADGNPARRLYERLGFVATGTCGLDTEMTWRSTH